ncbi:hypothetical protein G6F24_017698 [Rhizopus arrhizus]|nr:hypothetical protein G6F24_017698 [Rhizopus arrhizus]
MNPTTGKNYRGGNLLHLWALQSAWDTQDNRRESQRYRILGLVPGRRGKEERGPRAHRQGPPQGLLPPGVQRDADRWVAGVGPATPARRARYPSGLRSGAQGQRG